MASKQEISVWNDFFYKSDQCSDPNKTGKLFAKIIKENSLLPLKMMFNLRDRSFIGRGMDRPIMCCLKRLSKIDTMIYYGCLKKLANFGCWKDYLTFLLYLMFDKFPLNHDELRPITRAKSSRKSDRYVAKFDGIILKSLPKEERLQFNSIKSTCHEIQRKTRMNEGLWVVEKVTAADQDKPIDCKEKAKLFKEISEEFDVGIYYRFKTDKARIKKMNEYRRKYFDNVYKSNKNFATTYDIVVGFFAEKIIEDYENLKKNKLDKISMASKWIPNRKHFHDKYLFILRPIAEKFFEIASYYKSEIDLGIPKDVKIHRKLRTFERICTELRRKIGVTEISLSEKAYKSIDYQKVPFQTRLLYHDIFYRHDEDRFANFLEQMKQNRIKALSPGHMINHMYESLDKYPDVETTITEKDIEKTLEIQKQWDDYIAKKRKLYHPHLKNTLVMIDVCGYMTFCRQNILPIYSALGTAMMLMELSDYAWRDRFMVFAQEFHMYKIEPDQSILKRSKQILDAANDDRGCQIDLNHSLKKILDEAIKEKLSPDQLPKVFIILAGYSLENVQKAKLN
ncbi:hypothetical protein SSS_01154 [Sarcoptes scabiei]|uniref:Uncharacterized protein n=1 Tax=Sarcoptes scabiei TaxID=52283 RepID=A0A834R893_SARSC|nr:hypothetical protein SSS_01154 [Sarcoptes scabiei]